MMKETVKSLKWYFIVIGVFALFDVGSIAVVKENLIIGTLEILFLLFGITFIFIGAKLDTLLHKSSNLVIKILIADMVLIGIGGLYFLYSGMFVGANAFFFVVSFLVLQYLIKNVKRLSIAPGTNK